MKRIPLAYLDNQPNFSLSCCRKNKPLGLSPSQIKFTSPNPLRKTPLERGGIDPSHPSPHPKKTLLKKFKKILNPLFPFS
jgi:hypothetical protein